MKKTLIYILCFMLMWINVSYAAKSFENWPKLINSTNNSLSITWDKIDNTTWYYVYYSDISWKNYKTFWDVYTDNKVTITWLKQDTKYYIVVTFLDKTSNEESNFSPEWVFNTKSWSEEKFSLSEVKVINATNLELKFNNAVDKAKDAVREFKITKNDKEIANIKETIIKEDDDKVLKVELKEPLQKWEYKLIVIYITDINWKNIEEWINWELKFTVSEDNLKNNKLTSNETNEIPELTSWHDENMDLVEVPNNETTANFWLAWTAMTWVLSNGEVIATDSKKLPKTWPESILLVFVALLGGLIYLRKTKTI